MDRVLVIGATGQLGRAAIRKIKTRGASIRALTRSPESAAHFQSLGIEPVLGDLTDPASLTRACDGMTTLIATANAAAPTRPSDTFEARPAAAQVRAHTFARRLMATFTRP